MYTHLIFIICRFSICEFVYLLKFVWNLKISARAFTVICRHVQHGEQSEPSEAHVPKLRSSEKMLCLPVSALML